MSLQTMGHIDRVKSLQVAAHAVVFLFSIVIFDDRIYDWDGIVSNQS